MFKGLRTKIESEKQGQGGKRSSLPSNQINASSHKNEDGGKSSEANPSLDNDKTSNLSQKYVANNDVKILSTHKGHSSQHVESDSALTNEDLQHTISSLKTEIVELNNKLGSVIKEKDESNDQNAQLYQLIEKLRRNLELEKETNTSLHNKLAEAESALNEVSQNRAGETASNKSSQKKTTSSISIKTFDPILLSNDQSMEDDKSLRRRVNELQNQLSEKNRLLKIRQQNLNDIKKALQREMHEHSKTQEQLSAAQNQLKLQVQYAENGSNQNDMEAKTKNADESQELTQPSTPNEGIEDMRESTMLTPQLDTMSCLSQSSVSVDDVDSNDLPNKEVNLEYLRNVMFRYMTTNNTETMQHLVKALSLLLNFTPEQSAAIKSAMHSRSSWLRLK